MTIVTLTVNPAIDYASTTDEVVPVRKLRTDGERFDPGGGGINAARVVKELGGEALAVFAAGGITGPILERLIERAGIRTREVRIEGNTRLSHVVHERETAHEFRFTPGGPPLSSAECQALIDAVAEIDVSWLLASGSLAPAMPLDFYARIAELGHRNGFRVAVDCAGPPLSLALETGVHIVKPNLRELEHLAGRKARDRDSQLAVARDLVERGRAAIVAVTLGAEGALVVDQDSAWMLKSPKVEVRSAVGAGDSFLGAFVLALSRGQPVDEAFALAVAAGTATALTPGTELCHRADVDRFYGQLLPHVQPLLFP